MFGRPSRLPASIYTEPGIDVAELDDRGLEVIRFGEINLFFGGVQAVEERSGTLTGAGDPRRGGVAVSV